MTDELRFRAELPQDAATPVKPTKDTAMIDGVLHRKTRIWLDAWLKPGESEMVYLLGEEAELDITYKRRPKSG